MKKDSQKSYTERVNELEKIVNEVVHVERGLHTTHIFNKKDCYHHCSQEIRVMDYVTKHAYSYPRRLLAKAELFYLWYKDLMKG